VQVTSDHGATYDFCRATPGFTFRDGQIDGIDVRGRTVVGVQQASIELSDDGLRHSVRVGDAIDFEIEDIVPFGVEAGEPVRFAGMFRPVSSNLTMAEAQRSRIDAFGIQYEGKTGLSTSDFSWSA
jgi:hypothetical protein